MVTGHRFRRVDRIRRSADFAAVYALRQSASDGVLTVFARENHLEQSRLGLSVSRRLGGAVLRNRWKRRIREAFRRRRGELPPGLDLVVIPRRDARPTFHEIETSLLRLARRLARRLKEDRAP